ncbi:DUF4139 domain-containing protein [Micromonospora zhanjiangensis]|uniref:Mucoidy inhibitor MuiA family protein n=1 Tax=Micromonospora zhanjiangensis TaxID=1522057 RepID=A0ABV8KI72_9ACTN
MDTVQIEAPVVAVTVYVDRARVTRRGTVTLPAGQHRVGIGPLPLSLDRDSLRVGGSGPATVLGVDVSTRHQPRTTGERVADLERRRRAVAEEVAGLDDADAVERQRGEFLARLAERAGGTYARALAAGEAAPADVAAFADAVAGQLTDGRARQRELARRRTEATQELAALDREIQAAAGRRNPDQLTAEVTVAVEAAPDAAAEVELELTYLVTGASWQPSYDLRLVDETLTLTWFGMVSQRTGEDWPECDLQLSTARPAVAAQVPELSPWYLDRERPPPVPAAAPAMAAFGGGPVDEPGGPPPPGATRGTLGRAARPAAPAMKQGVAAVEQGVAAATYRPARAVAVPADGTAHRTTVAVLDLPAALDHVTVPVRSPEVHLRATVRNTSTHSLLPGPAAVFHGGDFVANTRLTSWAPGEETELALGLDDRVRVERELVRRGDTRAALGSTRRREVEYRTTVANHTPRPATVTVLDQLPVSRDESITVRETRLEPPPTERTDLGELTWRLPLPPAATAEITLAFRVDLPKNTPLTGWRE